MIRITTIQLAVTDRCKEESLATVLQLLDEAPACDLLLLPELWPSGFFSFDNFTAESEALDGPLITTLRAKIADKATHTMLGSFVERDGDNIFNTALMVDAGGEIIGRYRKVHLFGFQSRERALLTAGAGPVVFDLPWGRAGITTCYDLRFPEIYRLMVDAGATLFLIPSAWPMVRLAAWRLFNQARAHENLAYLLSCNCAGSSQGTPFAGHSMVVDPLGRIVAEAGDEGCYLTCEIDPQLPTTVRREFSALDDRVYRVADRQCLPMPAGPGELQQQFYPPQGEQMSTLNLTLATGSTSRPLALPVKRVVNAGYTGRNTEAVKAHIAELAREGVAPPPSVPMLYPLPAGSITLDERIEVVGERSSGEVEFVVLVAGGEIYIGVGSDHTDRELERHSVQASKQICPNILSTVVWNYREVEADWDHLLLRSWTIASDGGEEILYQETTLGSMLSPRQLLGHLNRALGKEEEDLHSHDGLVLYSGTTAILTAEMVFGRSFHAELFNPASGQKLSCRYRVEVLPRL